MIMASRLTTIELKKGTDNMKEKYFSPEIEIVAFETEDIIITSCSPETPEISDP